MLRSLHTELIKLRKDRAFLWSVAGFAGAPAMVTAMFLLSKADLVERGLYTGQFFAEQSVQATAFLMGPMMLAVLGTHLITSEYRQKALKSLLPLPMSLPGLVAAKAVWGVAGLALGLLASAGLTLVVPCLLGAAPGSLTYARLIGTLGRQAGMLLVVFPAQLFFAMAVSLVAKNFVVPLAASAFVLVGGMLAIHSQEAVYAWTTLPLLAVSSWRTHRALGPILGSGAVYGTIFLAACLLWARFTPRPE